MTPWYVKASIKGVAIGCVVRFVWELMGMQPSIQLSVIIALSTALGMTYHMWWKD